MARRRDRMPPLLPKAQKLKAEEEGEERQRGALDGRLWGQGDPWRDALVPDTTPMIFAVPGQELCALLARLHVDWEDMDDDKSGDDASWAVGARMAPPIAPVHDRHKVCGDPHHFQWCEDHERAWNSKEEDGDVGVSWWKRATEVDNQQLRCWDCLAGNPPLQLQSWTCLPSQGETDRMSFRDFLERLRAEFDQPDPEPAIKPCPTTTPNASQDPVLEDTALAGDGDAAAEPNHREEAPDPTALV
ncbi:uncharacterized protein LOC114793820 [Denticeps clupeoides]|uniref:uncharacterized protein LOC114793820 n=1 Tax=Denticeps clupeoides TaxID=299321 RepID=UPI0010A3BCC8|nr:uncharacterized protein LOC114793820 [Denticeps clupeoides]